MPKPPTVQPALGKRLLALRNDSKKSLFEVAYEAGTTPQAISMWERGEREPTLSRLKALAAIYGKTIDDLLDEQEAS